MLLGVSSPDNIICTANGDPAKICNIVKAMAIFRLFMRSLQNVIISFNIPLIHQLLKSLKFRQQLIFGILKYMSTSDVRKKCVRLPTFNPEDSQIIVPLLHSDVKL